jgi:hypothetical protein
MAAVGKVAMIGLLFLMGVAITGYGGMKYQEQREMATTYEQTEATIVSAEVERKSGSAQDGVAWVPDIVYEYTVDGETHRNSEVFLAGGTGSKFESEDIVGEHQAGTAATAYYDPDDPPEAYLIRNRTNGPLIVSGFGLLFALTGVLGVVGLFQD